MGELLRHAVQFKKKEIISMLIKQGIYKKNNKHLYELTLSELENEYKVYLKTSQKENNVLKIN